MPVPDYTIKHGIRHADIVTCEGHWLKIQNPRTDTTILLLPHNFPLEEN